MGGKKRLGSDPLKRHTRKKDTKKKKVSKSVSKHTDIQVSKDKNISGKEGLGKRATFYIKPSLLRELKILAVDTPDKNISELVNEAIEDLIKKYGW